MDNFSNIIKQERIKRNWILRHAAAKLDIDQAIISKFEKGERRPSREQVEKFALVYELNINDLLVVWLSDKILYDVKDEGLALQALQVAENRIKYNINIINKKK